MFDINQDLWNTVVLPIFHRGERFNKDSKNKFFVVLLTQEGRPVKKIISDFLVNKMNEIDSFRAQPYGGSASFKNGDRYYFIDKKQIGAGLRGMEANVLMFLS